MQTTTTTLADFRTTFERSSVIWDTVGNVDAIHAELPGAAGARAFTEALLGWRYNAELLARDAGMSPLDAYGYVGQVTPL